MKKILSMILALMLIITALPTVSLANDSIVIQAYGDALVKASNQWGFDDNTAGEYGLWNKVGTGANTNRANMYYSFEIPELSQGQVVESAVFTVYMKTPYMSDAGDHMRFYLVDKNWDEAKMRFADQPLTIETADTTPEKYYFPVADPDMTYVPGVKYNYTKFDIDVTTLLNKYVAMNNSDVRFSFLMAPYCKTEQTVCSVITRENSDATMHPTLTLQTKTVQALELASTTPENGATIGKNDAVSFTFTNNIDATTVSASDFAITDSQGTVSLNDEDITVADSTITLNKQWTSGESYEVTLSGISDVNGQSLATPATLSFGITGNYVSGTPIQAYGDAMVSASNQWGFDANTAEEYGFWNKIGSGAQTNRANIYYSFEIPELSQGQVVESAVFTVYMKTPYMSDAGDHMRFYLVDKNWDEAKMRFAEQPLTIEKTDTTPEKYYFPVADPDMTYVPGVKYNYTKFDIDVTSLFNKYVAMNKSDVRFSFLMAPYCKTEQTVCSVKTKENSDATQRPTLTLQTKTIQALELASTTPENGATIGKNDAVSFTFTNNIDSASVSASDFVVTNSAGSVSINDEDITVSDSTITINKQWTSGESYEVTLSGISDVNGQSLSSPVALSFGIEGDYISGTPIQAYADAMVRADKPWEYVGNSAEEYGLWNRIGAGAQTNRANMYYAFEVPEIPEGQVVESAIFTVYMKTPYMSDAGDHMRFYLVDKNWEEATMCFGDQPLTIEKSDTTPEKYYFPVADPDMTYITGVKYNYTKFEIDVAPLLNKYIANGNSDVRFSFLMAPYCKTENTVCSVKTKENSDATQRPTLTINTATLQPLRFVSSTPESGATIGNNDSVVFTFNNAIDVTSVTPDKFSVVDYIGNAVSVSAGDISVSGATVTLAKAWDKYSSFDVTISGISDIYGQTLASSANIKFKTESVVSSQSIGAASVVSMKLSGETVEVQDGASNGKVSGAGRYVVYKFNLPEADASKILANAEFTWWSECDSDYDGKVTVVPVGSWTDASGIDVDYYNSVASAMADSSNIVATLPMDFGPGYTTVKTTVDVTGAINNALGNGKQIAFAFTYPYTHNYYTSLWSSNAPSIKLNYIEPSFDAISSVPGKGGVLGGKNEPAKLTLATSLVNTSDNLGYVKLVRAYDNSNISAKVEFDASSNTLKVTPLVSLDERVQYKVVFKTGLKDTFGNTLATDKVATVFTVGAALEIFDFKFTNELTPIYDTCTTIENYSANSNVTAVTKVKNNSSGDADAIMVIAIYSSDDELLSVDAYTGKTYAAANDVTQYAKTIAVPNDAVGTKIKVFMLNGMDSIRPLTEHAEINQVH